MFNSFFDLIQNAPLRHKAQTTGERTDCLGYWDEFVQKACFKKLVCLCHSKQNDLTYLGRVCIPCLSVSTGDVYRDLRTKYFICTGRTSLIILNVAFQYKGMIR